jgi:uroporphyrinogen-III synthase
VLPDYLKEHGVQLEEVIVYKNEKIKKTITEKYSGILFFSPSAVKSFYSENPNEVGTLLFAFGESTKKALQTYSRNEIILNDEPNQAAFLEKIKKYFKHE